MMMMMSDSVFSFDKQHQTTKPGPTDAPSVTIPELLRASSSSPFYTNKFIHQVLCWQFLHHQAARKKGWNNGETSSFSTSSSGEEIDAKKKTDTVTLKASLSLEFGLIMLHYNLPGDLHKVSHFIHIFPLMGFQWLITACKQVIQYDSPDSDKRL